MEGAKLVSIQETVQSFNLLAEVTGNIYFIFDYPHDKMYLTDNIKNNSDIFPVCKSCCTRADCRRSVDSRDFVRLTEIIGDLAAHRSETFDFNFRVVNSFRGSTWMSSQGKAEYAEDGSLRGIIGQVIIKRSERQLETYNYVELKKEIRQMLDNVSLGYLLLIGVDNLKMINLQNGRSFGDAILNEITRILADETRHLCRIHRINGDCFAVNLPGANAEEVSRIFGRVQTRLDSQCTLSAGCVSYNDYHVADEGMLLQYAESALDFSKSNGKNQLSFFTPENYEKKLRELELRSELKESVKNGFEGFTMYYQPQLYTENFALFGAEALLRYQSSRYGNISPAEFIPILEQSGLIYSVGLWLIREALRACREWRAKIPDFHISINMSYRQLEYTAVEEDVLNLILSSGLPGNALTIEVTESIELSDYTRLKDCFKRWKRVGIELSVDDFGTGYSSLSRLKELAVDEIKIDRCFVRDIQNSAYNYRLLSNIIDLAASSKIRVCCEGIETQEELDVLRELHPDTLQGFYFSRPVTAAIFQAQYVDFSIIDRICVQSLAPSPKQLKPTDSDLPEEKLAQIILNAENDIFYLSDMDNYSLYYLNPAGQKMFGVKDYYGKKCYRVLHGKSEPCSFCTNPRLHRDSFYIWENQNEYCGRHFLLKNRIVEYKGKNVRLEVALDITKKEYLSQGAQERLSFANKMIGYLNILSECPDYRMAVDRVLSSLGDFYQADRAYLFEPSVECPGCWDNTFEWCAVDVLSQKESLQKIGPEVVSRWMEKFDRGESVIILNLAPLQEDYPQEWEVLDRQGIQRVIGVPVRDNGKTIAFIGVDNPRYCIQDDVQARALASFLLARIRQDRNEHRYQTLLQQENQDLLNLLHVGFWTLTVPKNGGHQEMVFDPAMVQLLAFPEEAPATECFEVWRQRISPESVGMVRQAFADMSRTDQAVRVVFPWRHPEKGMIMLRLSGILVEETASEIRYKGYCREISQTSLSGADRVE